MLEVLPIQSKSEQEALCARCNVKYDPDMLAYSAYSEGKTVGICQFTMRDGVGIIRDMACIPENNDFETMFVMGRSALNFIDLCGVHTAIYDGNIQDESLIKAVGFSKNSDGIYSVDLTDFFTHPCSHGKN